MAISSFAHLEKIFSDKGVSEIYVKHLAEKQDNEKNQIYLGKGGDGAGNILPSTPRVRHLSQSTEKGRSQKGRYIIEGLLDFAWLDSAGNAHPAPDAKIIDYFQYPEVRLSGFIGGCESPPDALRRTRMAKYGKRILVMGANKEKCVYGLVLTELEDPLVNTFPQLTKSEVSPQILLHHVIGTTAGANYEAILLDEIRQICGVWHPSMRLKPRAPYPAPFKGNQGAGYTLEALLNIPSNSSKSGDKYGIELKAFKKAGKISLMTPTPDKGVEGERKFKDFMNEYGWASKGRTVFTGTHRYHKPASRSQLVLDMLGYDSNEKSFAEDKDALVLGIIDPLQNLLVSGWSFEKLISSWNQKHLSAFYVQYEAQKHAGVPNLHGKDYKYTGDVYIGRGTTVFHFINAVIADIVYYEPGHSVSAAGEAKVRPQWRLGVINALEDRLQHLYQDLGIEKLI
jgi:hypothetical protein